MMPFPFSDLSAVKVRPALVLWDSQSEDIVVCGITSQLNHESRNVVPLNTEDFLFGGIPKVSHLLPFKIFTLHKETAIRTMGRIKPEKYRQVIELLTSVLS